jgi:hypothetical protein
MNNLIVKNYLPVTRVLLNDGVANAEALPGNTLQRFPFSPDPSLIKLTEGSALLLDFGTELVGGVAIVTNHIAGRIRLRFGESVSEVMGEPDQTHAIHDTELQLPRIGTFEYGLTGFRFVRIDALNDFEILNVMAATCERVVDRCGAFQSSDERLNRIWDAGRRTVHLCMDTYIVDGAKRDRLVWMGDLYPEVKSILAAFGDHPIIPASLDFIRDNSPLPSFMNRFASYSLWWVVCQHEYYRFTGNLAYLRTQHEYLAGMLRQFVSYIDENGVENMPPRRFLDWPSNHDDVAIHAGLQGLLCWSFRCGEQLAAALQDKALGLLCQESIRRLMAHRPSCNANKTAAAVQTLGGIADQSAILTTDPLKKISTFGGAFVLMALAQGGHCATGLDLIRNYWGGMIDRGATTFWEDFDLD